MVQLREQPNMSSHCKTIVNSYKHNQTTIKSYKDYRKVSLLS